MMQIRSFGRLPYPWLVLGVVLGGLLWHQRAAESNQATQQPPKWEYITAEVEEASLQAKLGEWALGGWEVFSVVNSEMELVQDVGNQPEIAVTKFTVTARKRK